MNNDVYNLFCSRIILWYIVASGRELYLNYFTASLYFLWLLKNCWVTCACSSAWRNIFDTCKSFWKQHPKAGMDFVSKILFPWFFLWGTFTYFLLVFTSIILSELISEVVCTFHRVYRCMLKIKHITNHILTEQATFASP